MLGMKTYPKGYIDSCRAKVAADVAAYRKTAAAARKSGSRAIDAFEIAFFNDMVLLLDYLFIHRLRTVEGKDGNALNEVRIICNSVLFNDKKMSVDDRYGLTSQAGLASIRLDPDRSILKYRVGDEIKVKEEDFVRLSEAFFAEIEKKYL